MSDKLALTVKTLTEPKTVKEMFDLPAVRSNWVQNYEKTTGKKDSELRFEAEKILFLQSIAANKKLEDCDRFSIYGSFVELAVSGLSLRDGQTYIIPYGKKAVFQIGWKGRLEQIVQIPTVRHINEPIVVLEGDDFEYELGENPRVIKHVRKGDPTQKRKPLAVYCYVDYTHGKKLYLMEAHEVLSIRDNYSTSWKQHIAALKTDLNKGKKIGDKLTFSGPNGKWESDELPMWVSDEIQAFKKTLVKRIYNAVPKTPRQIQLDKILADRPEIEISATNNNRQHAETEQETHDTTHETLDTSFGVVDAPENETPPQNGDEEQNANNDSNEGNSPGPRNLEAF